MISTDLSPDGIETIPGLGTRTVVVGLLEAGDEGAAAEPVNDPRAVATRARRLTAAGADAIEVAPCESPDADAEGQARLLRAVVLALAPALSAPVSVLTSHARLGAAALEAGARLLNDPTGFRRDPDLARVAAAHGALTVLGCEGDEAACGRDPVEATAAALSRSVDAALAAGLPASRLIVDPRLGGARPVAESLRLVREIGGLKARLGLPILITTSRRGLVDRMAERAEPSARAAAALALAAAAALAGADMIRTHEVAAYREAMRAMDALRQA
jgi:dihydropteroate synthase